MVNYLVFFMTFSSLAGHFKNKALCYMEPDFIGPIENVTAAVGREAALSCNVARLGQYKVGWMKADDQTILSLHTRVITHNPRITVSHDDKQRVWQLRIRQLKETDGGCYMCQINTNTMKKTTGCIDVQVPPDIDDVETSTDATVNEGENITLTCKASGHPEPRIVWRREDGNHILYNPNRETVDTFTGSTLNLIRLNRRHMGAYLCIASNDVPPAVSKRISLNVNFPPSIHVYKSLVGSPLGSSAKLKCEVEAFPTSTAYWMKENHENLLNSVKHTVQERRSGTKLNMMLTIHNITTSDYSTYRCCASNVMGKSDNSVRLYEIKIPTTTTTTSTTTEVPSTDTTFPEIITTEELSSIVSTRIDNDENRPLESDNWLFPSAAPAPLELETISAGSARLAISDVILIITSIFSLCR